MAKSLWLVIGAILVIVGGFWFWRTYYSPKDCSQVSALPAEQNSVIYIDGCFKPENLAVSSGTTVKFINSSTDSLQVASDPHPIHTGLSGFDSNRSLNQGESYQFTFTKAGTWGYHDHLHPGSRGAIVVEPCAVTTPISDSKCQPPIPLKVP